MGNCWPVVISALIVAGCTAQADPAVKPAGPAPADRAAAVAGQRHAYFGELHLHTSWSFDAYAFQNTVVDPDAAYRFAKGEAIRI